MEKETLEEAVNTFSNIGSWQCPVSFIRGAEWQQQNSYSEEDVVTFLEWIVKHDYKHYSNGWANLFNKAISEKELLEKFKTESK